MDDVWVDFQVMFIHCKSCKSKPLKNR